MFALLLIQICLHMNLHTVAHSLLNEYLWYDKLWGPSQRVVTLFLDRFSKIELQLNFIENIASQHWLHELLKGSQSSNAHKIFH